MHLLQRLLNLSHLQRQAGSAHHRNSRWVWKCPLVFVGSLINLIKGLYAQTHADDIIKMHETYRFWERYEVLTLQNPWGKKWVELHSLALLHRYAQSLSFSHTIEWWGLTSSYQPHENFPFCHTFFDCILSNQRSMESITTSVLGHEAWTERTWIFLSSIKMSLLSNCTALSVFRLLITVCGYQMLLLQLIRTFLNLRKYQERQLFISPPNAMKVKGYTGSPIITLCFHF